MEDRAFARFQNRCCVLEHSATANFAPSRLRLWLIGLLLALTLSLTRPCLAAALRTQSLELKSGWNAIFLEVEPVEGRLNEVFRGLPVDSVACFIPGSLQEQYLRTPGDAPWKSEGWATWYASSSPEAVLSDLFQLHSHRPYLIHASQAFTWDLTGLAGTHAITWYPNTCTFTGLPVDSQAPPTFKEFFQGSPAHQRTRIFRLQEGKWQLVSSPATDRPHAGEAYWIQTDGASQYQGPLGLKLSSSGGLEFDQLATERSLSLRNDGASTCQPRVEVVSGSLPLRIVTADLARRLLDYQPILQEQTLAQLPAGAQLRLRLSLDRSALTGAGDVVLRFSDGRGTEQWVPVSARSTVAINP